MIRISKLSDYALVIMGYMGKNPDYVAQTSDIALNTHISKPTAAKILKRLAKHNLLESIRGTSGGYKLTKAPSSISVANIIEIIEGPMAIMDCSLGQEHCAMYSNCGINAPWVQINRVIIKSLDTIKVSDLQAIAKQHGNANE